MLLNSAPLNVGTLNGRRSSSLATSGLRQFEADFETPGHHLIGTSTTRRPDAVSLDYLTAFSKGPVAIGDTSAGLEARSWYVRADAGQKLWIARSNPAHTGWQAETLLHDYAYSGSSPIVELDFCFDLDGNPVVVAERPSGDGDAAQLWIYWLDPAFEDFIFASHGLGRTPRCILDLFPVSPNPDICPWPADVQVVYVKPGDGLIRLQQDESWGTPHPSPLADNENIYLEDIFPTASRRLQVPYSKRYPASGTYELKRLSSKPYPESVLSMPLFSTDLAFDLTWYRGELYRDPAEGSATGNYTLRIIVIEACDVIELQCANSYPVGIQPDVGGIWTEQVQESGGGPINEGGFRTFDVSIDHGGGAMFPGAFRARVRKTIGPKTCYSPWRYWIPGPENDPDGNPILAFLVNCDRDAVVCFAAPGVIPPYVYQYGFVARPANPCDDEDHVSGADCGAHATGFFAGGFQPDLDDPFLWRQDWGVRVRSVIDIGFRDSHRIHHVTIVGRVFKSAASGAGHAFPDPSDQYPLQFPVPE